MADPKTKPPGDDTTAFRNAVEKGLESLHSRRSVPYEKVRRWLLSWGTDKEIPPPECP